MKNKLILITVVVGVVAFVLGRSCQRQPVKTTTTTTTDTTTVFRPDSTFHAPVLKDPVKLPPPPPTASQEDNWRQRYLFYKAESGRRKSEIEALTAKLDSAASCEERINALSSQVAALTGDANSAALVIELLNESLEKKSGLKKYEGSDTTEAYIHTYEITSEGGIPQGGYRYKTDVFQKTITTTTVTDRYFVKKNSVGLLYGYQEEAGMVLGLQAVRRGKTFGVVGQAGWLREKKRFQGLVGLEIQF